MREICFDTETTGLNPFTGDKIVEIACVELINRVKTGNSFHAYVNPRRQVPEGAFQVHGLSTEFLLDKPVFAHVAYKFLDFVRGAKLIAHNARFDMKFLNFELNLIGADPISNENVIDSLVIARQKFPGSPNSLDALCKRFSIDLGKRAKHGALLDSELLADVYIELMGGAQRNFNLALDDKKEDSLKEPTKNNREIIKNRNFKLSDSEIQGHQEFILKNFKENLWDY